MNPRNTLLLALAVAALGSFVWLYEIRGSEARLEAAEAEKRLFPDLEAGAISVLELETEDGQTARLERRAGVWHLALPLEFPADAAAADGLASAVADLSSEESFDDPAPLVEYGLDGEPRVRFEAGTRSGALRLGKTSPVGSNTYAVTDAGAPVHIVATHRATAFQKSLDDLREKRILDFDQEQLRRIELRWPEGRVLLTRDSGESPWKVAEPVSDDADGPTVDRLVSDLRYLRATGFDDEPAEDATLGLAPPAFEAELELAAEGAEPRRLSLAVGSVANDDKRAVRGPEAATVYEIAAAGLDDFPRRVDAYRIRELLRFAAADARRVELLFQEDGQSHSLTAERVEGTWSSSPDSIDESRLAQLVAELASLRAEGIVAESAGAEELVGLGLDPPRLGVRVLGAPPEDAGEGAEGPVLGELSFGVGDAERGIVVRRPGRETVYFAGYDLAETLPISVEALRERFVLQETGEAAPAGEEEQQPLQVPDEAP
jgi:hypothetical protein